MQAKLPFTASERVISNKVLQRFNKLYSRRMLIRLIGVKFSQLITGAYQADLFDDTLQDMSLSQAMDKIRMRYRSEEHTSELQSRPHLVCRLLLEKKKK